MHLWDGQQKISDWPEEIKNMISDTGCYRKDLAYGQSKYSRNEIYLTRLEGITWFISYNKNLKVFSAWHIECKLDAYACNDRVLLKIPKTILSEIEKRNFSAGEKYSVPININNKKIFCDTHVIDERGFLNFFKYNIQQATS